MSYQGGSGRRTTGGGESYHPRPTAYHRPGGHNPRAYHEDEEDEDDYDEGAPLNYVPRQFGHQRNSSGQSQEYQTRRDSEEVDDAARAYRLGRSPEDTIYTSGGSGASGNRALVRQGRGGPVIHQSPTPSFRPSHRAPPRDQPVDDNSSRYSQGAIDVSSSRSRYIHSTRYNDDREDHRDQVRDRDQDGDRYRARENRPPRTYQPNYVAHQRPPGRSQQSTYQGDGRDAPLDPNTNPFAPRRAYQGEPPNRNYDLNTAYPEAPPLERRLEHRRVEEREDPRQGSQRYLAPPTDAFAGDESDDPNAQVWPRVEVRGVSHRYTEVSSFVDTGNLTGYNLISSTTIRDLGYDERYIDRRQVRRFRVLGGEAETVGSISLKCRIRMNQDDKDDFLRDEFQIFDDETMPHDVIFAGDSNSGPRPPSQQTLMMVLLSKKRRTKDEREKEKEKEDRRKRLKAQQEQEDAEEEEYQRRLREQQRSYRGGGRR